MNNNVADKIFFSILSEAGITRPHTEYRFHEKRKWRFDYAWPESMVALEVEGGVWTRGRHVRGAGFIRDMDKYNAAAVLGWRVVRVTPDNLCTRATEDLLRSLLMKCGS